jgi:hypothetical protein
LLTHDFHKFWDVHITLLPDDAASAADIRYDPL